MPITFDDNQNNSRESLERFYRTRGADTPWRQPREEFMRDPLNAIRIEVLCRAIQQISPDSLLDVGCGAGLLVSDFAAQYPGAFAVGLDLAPPDPDQYSQAALNRPCFIASDAVALPFGTKTFQCIACSETLEHLPDPAAALAEFKRVMSPGGNLLITVPNLFCLDSVEGKLHVFEAVGKALHSAGITSAWRNGINTHIQKKAPREWAAIISAAGFEIIESRPVRIFPYVPHFLGPLKKLESAALGAPAMLGAQMAMDRALRRAPIGQLHFFNARVVN